VAHRDRRAPLRAVAVPTEHGGWGLTLEPALLGLLVAWSAAGAALAVATLLAFLVRTPLKVVLVDRWRRRWLPRSRTAALVVTVEAAALVATIVIAVAGAGWRWIVPVLVAAPLVAVQLWFDMRSRSRRLLPELASAVGIGSAATAIALAGGASTRIAYALWVVVAARAVASLPFARVQIQRLHHSRVDNGPSDAAQAVGVGLAVASVVVHHAATLGALAVIALVAAQIAWTRRRPRPAKAVGITQAVAGLLVVLACAAGVRLFG
jgi:hypothetical protein